MFYKMQSCPVYDCCQSLVAMFLCESLLYCCDDDERMYVLYVMTSTLTCVSYVFVYIIVASFRYAW